MPYSNECHLNARLRHDARERLLPIIARHVARLDRARISSRGDIYIAKGARRV